MIESLIASSFWNLPRLEHTRGQVPLHQNQDYDGTSHETWTWRTGGRAMCVKGDP